MLHYSRTIINKFPSEFIPYVFQIFSQLLELHQEPQLPEVYKSLLPPLLLPNLWESSGMNIAILLCR